MIAAGNRVQGFLGAGHVCTITGLEEYHPFVDRFRVPVVVTGFEPIDLLHGIRELVRQLQSGRSGRSELINCYSRSVRTEGNVSAQNTMDQVYEAVDAPWRGLGVIARGGLQIVHRYRHFDARHRFSNPQPLQIVEEVRCRSGDVLAGRIKPTCCPEFGKTCRPEQPLGAPMVSSEGACAAYYRYHSSPL